MPALAPVVAFGFAREYDRLAQRVHELTAPLSEDEFWTNPFTYGNSPANLVLHLTGNLNYYIGARLAGTGYVRDRDREFTESVRRPKNEVMRDFDAAVRMVVEAVRSQQPEDWTHEYSAVGEPDAHTRFDIVLNCAMHLYHHVGQLIYLEREHARRRAL